MLAAATTTKSTNFDQQQFYSRQQRASTNNQIEGGRFATVVAKASQNNKMLSQSQQNTTTTMTRKQMLTQQQQSKKRGHGGEPVQAASNSSSFDPNNWKNRIKSIQQNTLKTMMNVLNSNTGGPPPSLPQPQIDKNNNMDTLQYQYTTMPQQSLNGGGLMPPYSLQNQATLVPVNQYGPFMYGRKLPMQQSKIRSQSPQQMRTGLEQQQQLLDDSINSPRGPKISPYPQQSQNAPATAAQNKDELPNELSFNENFKPPNQQPQFDKHYQPSRTAFACKNTSKSSPAGVSLRKARQQKSSISPQQNQQLSRHFMKQNLQLKHPNKKSSPNKNSQQSLQEQQYQQLITTDQKRQSSPQKTTAQNHQHYRRTRTDHVMKNSFYQQLQLSPSRGTNTTSSQRQKSSPHMAQKRLVRVQQRQLNVDNGEKMMVNGGMKQQNQQSSYNFKSEVPVKKSPFLKHALQNQKLQRRLKEQSISFQSKQEATSKQLSLKEKQTKHQPKQIQLVSPREYKTEFGVLQRRHPLGGLLINQQIAEHLPRSPVSGHRHPQMVAFGTAGTQESQEALGAEWKLETSQKEPNVDMLIYQQEEQLLELAAQRHEPYLPDLYLPFTKCLPLIPSSQPTAAIQYRKAQRQKRKNKHQQCNKDVSNNKGVVITNEITCIVDDNNSAASFSNSQQLDLTNNVQSTTPPKTRNLLENDHRHNSPTPDQQNTIEILRHTPLSSSRRIENGQMGSGPKDIKSKANESSQRIVHKSVTRLPFKRQLTDKYPAEKLRGNNQRLNADGSRKGSNEQKHGFQSDFSQKAVQTKNTKNSPSTQRDISEEQVGLMNKRKNLSSVHFQQKLIRVRKDDRSPPLSLAHVGCKRSQRKSNSTDSKQQRVVTRTHGFRQNMPNKGQMKTKLQESHYKQFVVQRKRAEAQAIHLLQNKDDMYEKYLRKPQKSSVGFLVMEKISSQSKRQHQKQDSIMRKLSQLSHGKQSSSKSMSRHWGMPGGTRENSMSFRHHEMPNLGKHINSDADAGRSPIPSSRNDNAGGGLFKDHDGGDSFAMSLQQINQEDEVSFNICDKQHILTQQQYDSLGTESISAMKNESNNNISQSKSISPADDVTQRTHTILDQDTTVVKSSLLSYNQDESQANNQSTRNNQQLNINKINRAVRIAAKPQSNKMRKSTGSSSNSKPSGSFYNVKNRILHNNFRQNRVNNRTYQTEKRVAGTATAAQQNEINFSITNEVKDMLEGDTLCLSQEAEADKTSKFGGGQHTEDFTSQAQATFQATKSNEQSAKLIINQQNDEHPEKQEQEIRDQYDSHEALLPPGQLHEDINLVKTIQNQQENNNENNQSPFGSTQIIRGDVDADHLNRSIDAAAQAAAHHSNNATGSFVVNQRPRTGKTVPSHFGMSYQGKLIFNQTSKVPRQVSVGIPSYSNPQYIQGQKRQGMLTQAKITKRRSQQRGSRFAYAFDCMHQRAFSKGRMQGLHSEERIMGCTSEIKQRNVLTPEGDSVAITGASTQYNNNTNHLRENRDELTALQIQQNNQHYLSSTLQHDGLRCFGNPTLETLNILDRLPTLDQQIKKVLKKGSGVSDPGNCNAAVAQSSLLNYSKTNNQQKMTTIQHQNQQTQQKQTMQTQQQTSTLQQTPVPTMQAQLSKRIGATGTSSGNYNYNSASATANHSRKQTNNKLPLPGVTSGNGSSATAMSTLTSPKKHNQNQQFIHSSATEQHQCFPQTQQITTFNFMGYTGSKHRYYSTGNGKLLKKKLVLPSQVN